MKISRGLISRIFSLRKKKFIKDLGILQVGSFINASLSFLVSVIFARILGVNGYAQYILMFTFLGLASLFTNWGEQGVVLAIAPEYLEKKEKEKFKEVIIYYFFVTTLSTFVAGVIAFIFAPKLSLLLYHDASVGFYARVIFIMAMFQIFSFFIYATLQILRKIKQYTALDILDKTAQLIFPALMVITGFGLWGLVWGKMAMAFISAIIAIIIYHVLAKRNDYIPSFKEMFFNFRFSIIKKYFKFGVGISLDKNISNFDNLLPVLLLGYFGTVPMVAFYKLGYSYINLPALLLSPVSQLLSVQLPKSKAYGQRILRRDFWRSTIFGGLVNAVLVCGLVILAWPLVYFFYGSNFLGSVEVVYYLSFTVFLGGFSVGIGSILRTIRKVKVSILMNLSVVIIQIVLFFIFYYLHFDVLIAVLISQIIATAYNIIFAFYFIDKYLKNNSEIKI